VNIFTPRLDKILQPLPVMAFLPGGHFEQGSAGTWVYWGDRLVNQSNVVLITINYRLGALGWLGSTKIPGNYGLEDQRFALKWIQANIANFGGDPDNVLLFGQSAGGTSTAVHMTTSASQGLFHKAIIHSNPFTLPLQDPTSASFIAYNFAVALDCPVNDLDCFRSKTTQEIVAASSKATSHVNISNPLAMFYPWTPILDGVRVEAQPIYAFQEGKFARMPTMIGNVEEEALMFIWEVFTSPTGETEYIRVVEAAAGNNSVDVLALYPPTPYDNTDYRYLMNQMGSDWIFTCPNRYVAAGISKNAPEVPLYMYRFNQAMSFDGWGPNYTYCVGHVCHGGELAYLYQSQSCDNSGFVLTDQEQQMADAFGAMWGNFAHTGNPNVPGVGKGFDTSKNRGNQVRAPTGMVDAPWPLWTPDQDIRMTI